MNTRVCAPYTVQVGVIHSVVMLSPGMCDVTTVERVVGFKRGTGGTGGVSYLRKMLEVVLFPAIWSLRAAL